MKVLIDVSAGRAVADAIQKMGHDVVSVRDRDAKMADPDILDWAVAEGRLVVTMDKDFGELVYRTGRAHSGILLLRLEAARTAEKIAVIESVFAQYEWALAQHFCVYQDGRLRVR